MKRLLLTLPAVLLCANVYAQSTFSVSFPASQSKTALDGRVLLMLAKTDKTEPRQQVGDAVETAQVFGVDVNGLKPGQAAMVDASAFGYPKESLREIAPGDYYVQAVLHNTKRSKSKTAPTEPGAP